MKAKYFLYIDILGFTDMVKADPRRIEDLYEVIATLNVHKHGSFKAIIFSDTVLVYNLDDPEKDDHRRYIVMFLCEFAQDLQHRLVGRDIYFRAIIVYGGFTYYELNGVPCFYGDALIETYSKEKDIKCTGLFITDQCNQYNDIFQTSKFRDDLNFVFLTQNLHQLEYLYGGNYPMDDWLLRETDLCWYIASEVFMLQAIYRNMIGNLPPEVKRKYETTWEFFKRHYPQTVSTLVSNDFNLRAISDFDWTEMIERIPRDYSWIHNK